MPATIDHAAIMYILYNGTHMFTANTKGSLQEGNMSSLVSFFFNLRSGGWSPNWVHSARRPFVPGPGDCEDGEFVGMNGRRNRSTRRKPAPAPLCAPQIPFDETPD
jgi:hypothetical protein